MVLWQTLLDANPTTSTKIEPLESAFDADVHYVPSA